MKLEETAIYPYIRYKPDLCEIHTFLRGTYIARAENKSECIWYLVSGRVKVVANGPTGKSLLVDLIEPDNFVGHLSNYHRKNFYCDSIAQTSSTLIRIPIDIFYQMMEGLEFSRLFFQKTNERLYDMYKSDLMRHLFTQRQQLAFYVHTNAKDGVCRVQSLNTICEVLRISRRNLYYLIDGFVKDGYLERTEGGDIVIINEEAIRSIEEPVYNFQHNNH